MSRNFSIGKRYGGNLQTKIFPTRNAISDKLSFLFHPGFIIDRMLLKLPEYVIASVVSCWIRLRELGLLDTACCNQTHRIDLLNILSSSWFEFQASSKLISPTVILWIQERNLTMQRVLIELGKSRLKNKLILEAFLAIAQTWTSLRSFSYRARRFNSQGVIGHSIESLCHLIILNNPKLTALNVDNVGGLEQLIVFIADNAKQIERVHIRVIWTWKNVYIHQLERLLLYSDSIGEITIRCEQNYYSRIHVKYYRSQHQYSVSLENVHYRTKNDLSRDICTMSCIDNMLNLVLTNFAVQNVDCEAHDVLPNQGENVSWRNILDRRHQYGLTSIIVPFTCEYFKDIVKLFKDNQELWFIAFVDESIDKTNKDVLSIIANHKNKFCETVLMFHEDLVVAMECARSVLLAWNILDFIDVYDGSGARYRVMLHPDDRRA